MKFFKIFDWAGNEMKAWGQFKSFDDAWDHIMAQAPDDADDDWFGEFFVDEVSK